MIRRIALWTGSVVPVVTLVEADADGVELLARQLGASHEVGVDLEGSPV